MFDEFKETFLEANLRLFRSGLVFHTFGNVSCADQEHGVFAIKPSGIEYEALKADDIPVVGFEGNIVSGRLRPSSDTPTHAVLYCSFAQAGGIVHTHSPYVTVWAQAKRSIPLYGTTHADYLSCPVPCIPWPSDKRIQKDCETETGRRIVDFFQLKNWSPEAVEMILLCGHGPFAWGKNAADAVTNILVLKELAKMAVLTEQINPEAGPLKQSMTDKHYCRKHGKEAYYGQNKHSRSAYFFREIIRNNGFSQSLFRDYLPGIPSLGFSH